jgi:hypothetical protein
MALVHGGVVVALGGVASGTFFATFAENGFRPVSWSDVLLFYAFPIVAMVDWWNTDPPSPPFGWAVVLLWMTLPVAWFAVSASIGFALIAVPVFLINAMWVAQAGNSNASGGQMDH